MRASHRSSRHMSYGLVRQAVARSAIGASLFRYKSCGSLSRLEKELDFRGPFGRIKDFCTIRSCFQALDSTDNGAEKYIKEVELYIVKSGT